MPEATLLVADDAREIREFVADVVLRPNGYRVLEAADGATALELITRERPQLVISDIKMPGITGLDLARAVHHEWPGLPVILITAEGSEEIAQQALRAGVFDYFIKPFDPEELLQSVARALARSAPPVSRSSPVPLPRPREELETLLGLSRDPAALPDPDQFLRRVVGVAVSLTGAEAGRLLVFDEAAQALVVRAAHTADGAEPASRAPAEEALALQVWSTGQPAQPGGEAPAQLYVPMHGRERIIGVLGVDRRQARPLFDDHAERLLRLLADYAASAIENARLYADVEAERARLYTILNEIEDGVIVLDAGGRLVLVTGRGTRRCGRPAGGGGGGASGSAGFVGRRTACERSDAG